MSQPLNSFMSESPDSFISSLSDNYVTTQKHLPKLSEIRKISPPYRNINLNSRVDSVRTKCSTDQEYPSGYISSGDPSDPLFALPSPGEWQHKSPHAVQFQNCAKEILEEIETLLSSTGQVDSISRGGVGGGTEDTEGTEGTTGGIELLPHTASETVYSILGYAYQQQVSAAAYALQCLAGCKVEVAISKSISLLSVELHGEQEQVHLRSIMESLDQTFPSESGERSIPTHVSSGMVDLRVKALLKNFRKRVDKVLANSSILDWMKNSQQLEESPSQLSKQVSQRMSIISWMMAASTSSSSSSSSSSSEDEESQPVSVQRIRSIRPLAQQGHLDQSQDLDIFQGHPSISDVTFKFFRSKSIEKERMLMHSEPSLFKHRESDSSIPCSTSTDPHSTSLEWSKSLGSRGPLRKERVIMTSEPPLHSSLGTPPTDAGVEMRPVRGRIRTNSRQLIYEAIVDNESAESSHRQENIMEGRDHTTRIINESKKASEEEKPLFLRSLLKPSRSFEESNRALGKSVEFADIPRKTLSVMDMGESVDLEEMNFLEEAQKSMMGIPVKRSKLLPLPSLDVFGGIPELLSGSVSVAFPDHSEIVGTDNDVKECDFEQEWRAFQVTFEADVYSSLHRLRQNSINLSRKMEHMQEYSRGMTECVRRLTTSLSDETAPDRDAFYSDLSFFNSLLDEVVGTSHTVGALKQENKDNSVFKLCLKYVEKLKGNNIRHGIISPISSPLSAKQDTLGSVSSEPVLLTEESVQGCIERYISQPAQVMKWPAFRFEFSKFAADQARVNSELSLLAKQYGKLIEQCGREIQWLKFSMKLLIVILFLLLLLMLSAESFEKSIYNILVNLRLM